MTPWTPPNERSHLGFLTFHRVAEYEQVQVLQGRPYGNGALHNAAGHVTDRRKTYLANEFRSKYRNDIEGFVEFMTNTVAVPGDYHGTWKYISEGTRSLERGSNLHILLNETRRLG